jgi:5-methylcytosine-specific restriction endonuclease McrA
MKNTYEKHVLEDLILVQNLPYTQIGKMFNVSATAIVKASKKLGIDLKQKRKINSFENFNKNNKSKAFEVSDEDFIDIINSNTTWKGIYSSLGYSKKHVYAQKKIKLRCEILGIEPFIKKIPKILFKTKGELSESRKNYQSYRGGIRQNAITSYINSGRPLKCAVCDYDIHVQIAHIKPVSKFKSSAFISDINAQSNLIALCPNHHWEYDHKILNIDHLVKDIVIQINKS